MEEELEKCRLRWIIDVEVETERGLFREQLALLPNSEQDAVCSFQKSADKYRALTSRLLQRCCVCHALGVEWSLVTLALTKGRKPFTTNPKPAFAPNFNYNVSHEGRYVALVADPLYLVGVDVAAPRRTRPGGASRPLEQYLQMFRDQLAENEWALLQGLKHDETLQEAAFQRMWSLKEAYTKARGDGLGFQPFSRAAFQFDGDDPKATSAQLVLDGAVQSSWRFALEDVPHGHCVSVAVGPPAAVVDEFGVFRSTFKLPHVAPTHLDVSRPFTWTSLDDLLQDVGALKFSG